MVFRWRIVDLFLVQKKIKATICVLRMAQRYVDGSS
jgi:hypothetical protein